MVNIKSAKQALNPAFLKLKPERKEIELFKKEFIALLNRINEKESEEFHKNLMIEFLNSVYYKDKHYINTKGRADLVIHNDNSANSPVGALIEVKSPANRLEMVSKENLNVKSFQELVLYYLRERKIGKNFELRYLIITNIYEYFVFDARNFEDTFGKDANLEKKFNEFENKTSAATTTKTFYKEIAAPAIAKYVDKIEYTHFDVRDYETVLLNADKDDDKQLIALYKFLSPTHLLKLPFANDSNILNREFYAELLHILGLEEIKQDNRNLIVRKKPQERDAGSIIENAIEMIDATDRLKNIDAEQFGANKEERLFNVALDLTITWINRILFLKLLEAQIIKYHNGNKNYAFLTIAQLGDYDDLNSLFFFILARTEEERKGELKTKFAHVPYLNSSLFDKTETEDNTIFINNLINNIKIKLYAKSVLNTRRDAACNLSAMRPLEYLLRFLDAYDFSSEGAEDIQEENKSLISSSVLGLIFEKINGYKDGSFFTPTFITMYICRETIAQAVLQKFNDYFRHYGLDPQSPETEGDSDFCQNDTLFQTITDLYNKIDRIDIQTANQIFNSIRICDPAVGSGHFLVSALNELIRLKADLGILADKSGKRLKDYRITIENDELIITDQEGNFFNYNPRNAESQRVQETLFAEKQTIIENCLFGVDINPNSVKICQLRLWIELLKNTYYRSGTNELETLPNIDINIKCGNSLISRFDLKDIQIGIAVHQTIQRYVHKYKQLTALYKQTTDDKQLKHEYLRQIDDIKKNIINIHDIQTDKEYKALREAKDELYEHSNKRIWADYQSVEWQRKHKTLADTVMQIEVLYNKKVRDSFEWRFEFPEALDDDGRFEGFDAVIGNPPYIQLPSMGHATADALNNMNYQVFARTGDIYSLFYERGWQLLKPQGRLCFITSNKWMRAGYGENTRRFFAENTNPELLIDFAGVKVFDSATVDVNILMFSKDKNRQQTQACIVKKEGIKELSVFVRQNATPHNFATNESWIILSPIEKRIKQKIEAIGTPLKDWDIQINYGIKTGFNGNPEKDEGCFIISKKQKDKIIAEDPKSAEIIRPILRGRDIKRYGYEFADLYIITTFPSLKIDIEQYPAIKQHLMSFGYDRLKQTGEAGARKKTNNQWFETQDTINYWADFYRQKIIYSNMSSEPKFALDNDGFLTNQKCFILIGNCLEYLFAFFNSKLFKFIFNNYFPVLGENGREMSKIYMENIPIPKPTKETEQQIEKLLHKQDYQTIDMLVYKMYGLSEEEREYIEK